MWFHLKLPKKYVTTVDICFWREDISVILSYVLEIFIHIVQKPLKQKKIESNFCTTCLM